MTSNNHSRPTFPSDQPALEFRHVSLWFDEVLALDDLSFQLAQNEMLMITGPSDAGKSVLLRLAMGMYRPDKGQIFVQGQEISAMEEEEILQLRSQMLGLVFQDEALFTALNVYDNTAYRLVEHGWGEAETEQTVLEILRFVGLDNELQKNGRGTFWRHEAAFGTGPRARGLATRNAV